MRKWNCFLDEKVRIWFNFNFIAEYYLMATENYINLLLFNQPSNSH